MMDRRFFITMQHAPEYTWAFSWKIATFIGGAYQLPSSPSPVSSVIQQGRQTLHHSAVTEDLSADQG